MWVYLAHLRPISNAVGGAGGADCSHWLFSGFKNTESQLKITGSRGKITISRSPLPLPAPLLLLPPPLSSSLLLLLPPLCVCVLLWLQKWDQVCRCQPARCRSSSIFPALNTRLHIRRTTTSQTVTRSAFFATLSFFFNCFLFLLCGHPAADPADLSHLTHETECSPSAQISIWVFCFGCIHVWGTRIRRNRLVKWCG